MDFLADTVFLIDLWREGATPGRATRFARHRATSQVGLCWVVAGEFLSGARAAGQDTARVATFLSRYPVIHSSDAIVRAYAEIYAALRAVNGLIGPNDCWIAASALACGVPLITRNAAEFMRVPRLHVVDYSAD